VSSDFFFFVGCGGADAVVPSRRFLLNVLANMGDRPVFTYFGEGCSRRRTVNQFAFDIQSCCRRPQNPIYDDLFRRGLLFLILSASVWGGMTGRRGRRCLPRTISSSTISRWKNDRAACPWIPLETIRPANCSIPMEDALSPVSGSQHFQ
jgi:hypothetical protein